MVEVFVLAALLATPAAEAASRLVVRMDQPANVYVDGQGLRFDRSGRNAILEGLAPGRHQVRVVAIQGGVTLWEGEIDVADDAEVLTRWPGEGALTVRSSRAWDGVTAARGKKADWVTIAAAVVDLVTGEETAAGALKAGLAGQGGADTGRTRAPVEAGGPATVSFQLGEGMVNVWIDGVRVLELRQPGQVQHQLSPGDHLVEFKGFGDIATLARGHLTVASGGAVTFQVAEKGGVIATEGASAWKPE
jgi:hypothetical protein